MEICICAAVLATDGTIVRGHRHADCIYSIIRMNKTPSNSVDAQGFITSTGRYVSREEGRKLQDAANIKSKVGYKGQTLFSEDLY
jgi:hypothetical protein